MRGAYDTEMLEMQVRAKRRTKARKPQLILENATQPRSVPRKFPVLPRALAALDYGSKRLSPRRAMLALVQVCAVLL